MKKLFALFLFIIGIQLMPAVADACIKCDNNNAIKASEDQILAHRYIYNAGILERAEAFVKDQNAFVLVDTDFMPIIPNEIFDTELKAEIEKYRFVIYTVMKMSAETDTFVLKKELFTDDGIKIKEHVKYSREALPFVMGPWANQLKALDSIKMIPDYVVEKEAPVVTAEILDLSTDQVKAAGDGFITRNSFPPAAIKVTIPQSKEAPETGPRSYIVDLDDAISTVYNEPAVKTAPAQKPGSHLVAPDSGIFSVLEEPAVKTAPETSDIKMVESAIGTLCSYYPALNICNGEKKVSALQVSTLKLPPKHLNPGDGMITHSSAIDCDTSDKFAIGDLI